MYNSLRKSPVMVIETLEETKTVVWPEIERHLKDPNYPKQFQIEDKFKKDTEKYWKINKIYPERKGKYLRPTLVRLTAESLGFKGKVLNKVAAAMQLSEEWILIHDDIEDNSEERRNGPTLHREYGTSLAINAGDVLNIITLKMVNEIDIPEISDEFYKILLHTTLGQGIELIWTREKKKITDEDYFFQADSKSGYYSMAGPMRLGAILAKATPKQLDLITEFGLHLGRCFQIVDDILDIKQDKKEGKTTIATLKGIEYARKLAEKESQTCKKIFERDLKFLSNEPARTKLEELTTFILERKH